MGWFLKLRTITPPGRDRNRVRPDVEVARALGAPRQPVRLAPADTGNNDQQAHAPSEAQHSEICTTLDDRSAVARGDCTVVAAGFASYDLCNYAQPEERAPIVVTDPQTMQMMTRASCRQATARTLWDEYARALAARGQSRSLPMNMGGAWCVVKKPLEVFGSLPYSPLTSPSGD